MPHRHPTLATLSARPTIGYTQLALHLRTPRRVELLGPAIQELLANTDLRFLTDLRAPDRHERGAARVRQAGDPLSVYWADLRRLRPTQREDELVLAHAIVLLRGAIAQLLGD